MCVVKWTVSYVLTIHVSQVTEEIMLCLLFPLHFTLHFFPFHIFYRPLPQKKPREEENTHISCEAEKRRGDGKI